MRALLLAFLLCWLPGAAAAQAQSPSMLQEMGAWAQRLSAAQQPVVDAYRDCAPMLRKVQGAQKSPSLDRDALRGLVGSVRDCLERMRTAGMTTRDALASMGPMPAVVEQGLHIDSRDILRRTAEATGGAVGYVEKVQEALEAALAGDRDLFVSKMAEARVLAGSTMDGQIVLLETLRQSLPLPTHKSMIDIRLAIERSIRAVGVTDFQAGTSELAARFRAEAVNARTAAQQLRANWKRDSVNLRAAVARLGDPRRTALFASLDKGFEDIAAAGERAAAALDGTPAGAISEEEGMRIVQELVASELVILEAARAFAVAASQIG